MIRGNVAVRREAHLRRRSNDPPRERFVPETNAEGATAPETLRQKDRVGEMKLWKAGRVSVSTEGVSAGP